MSSTTASPAPAKSLSTWIQTHRDRTSHILLGLSGLMLVVAILLGIRWNAGKPQLPPAAEKQAKEEISLKEEKPTEEEQTRTRNPDYLWSAIWAGMVALTLAGVSIWNLNRLPDPSREGTMARIVILAAGGSFGILTALLGLKLAYHWESSLTDWVDRGSVKEARWVLASLSILVVGLVVAFLSLQQARTEVRTSSTIRRFVYGYNTALLSLMGLILLIAMNMAVSAKLPDKIDTTEGGFYSLNPASEKLLKEVNQPIHAYFVAPSQLSGSFLTDIRALFKNCQRVNPRFDYKFLVPGLDNEKIAELYTRLEIAEADQGIGLILTVGDDEVQNKTFLPLESLARLKTPETNLEDEQRRKGPPPTPQLIFEGEGKIMTEIMFLSEGKVRPILYVNQGAGELEVNRKGPGNANRSATQLEEALRSRKFELKTFDLGKVSSNDWMKEASILVLLGPQRPYTETEVKQIREYLRPTDGRKPGKLLAFLPPTLDGTNRSKIGKTGLEELLQEFGIVVASSQVISQPILVQTPQGIQLLGYDAVGDPSLLASGHPLAGILQKPIAMRTTRPIMPSPIPGMDVSSMLVTSKTVKTCIESSTDVDPLELWKEIERDPTVAAEKQAGNQNISLAVLVTQPGTPPVARMAIFGMADFISDGGLDKRSKDPRLNVNLVVSTIDWLRDKPSNIGISPLVHHTFFLGREADEGRLLWMPLGLSFVTIVGLGMGIWLMRRT